MRCKYCQAEYEENYNRCPNCGMREEYETSTVTAVPEPKRKKIWHDPFHWYWHAIARFARYRGRARRSEYFYFQFFSFLGCFFCPLLYAGMVDKTFFDRPEEMAKNIHYVGAVTVAVLATLAPLIALTVRRLHDIGLSGWYFVVAICIQWVLSAYGLEKCATIVPLCLFVWPSASGENEFGPDPRYTDDEPRKEPRKK